VLAVYMQHTFRRVKAFSFQGLVRSVYSEYIERNYAILFDPTQHLELSKFAPD